MTCTGVTQSVRTAAISSLSLGVRPVGLAPGVCPSLWVCLSLSVGLSVPLSGSVCLSLWVGGLLVLHLESVPLFVCWKSVPALLCWQVRAGRLGEDEASGQ